MRDKVVLIADEKFISALYKNVLEKAIGDQVEIHCFSSAAEALEKLNSLTRVDLLLTGRFTVAEGINGRDLAIAYNKKFSKGKLIIASGSDNPAVFEGAVYNYFLLRGTKNEEIVRIVKELLQIF